MKNFQIILFAIFASIFFLNFSSCGDGPSRGKTQAISILIDRTDKLQLEPEKELIYGLFKLNPKSLTEVEMGVTVRVSEISSVDFNRNTDVKIEPVDYHAINIKSRQKEIKKFYEELEKAFTQTEIITQGNSSIFVPIAREANRLAESSANKKMLIVYSDLSEHSSWLNAYKEHNTPTATLIKKFKQQIELTDLTGLNVVIRYIPRNTDDNTRFNNLIKVYSQIFEEKGAVVSFEF